MVLKMKKNKICVYTCITGNYDNLKEIKKEKGIDYYCFTNNKNIVSNSWNVVYIEEDNLSNVKLARKIKILGHDLINNYDVLLWMDAAVIFKKNITDFINCFFKSTSFAAFKHGVRDNIKDECFECVKFGKESKENVKKLLKFYEKQKFDDSYGLIESTVFIKKPKDKKVIETMKLWYDMILNYSHRDQLSFNWCISKTGLNVKWINGKVFDNEWFSWIKHNSNRVISKYRLYFGDENNYILDNDVQGNYEIHDDIYLINTTVPTDTDILTICPCHVLSTFFDGLKINDLSFNDYEMKSVYDYNDLKVFYDENPFIIVNKHFKKGEQIKLELKMRVMNDSEVAEFAYFLANEKNLMKSNYENIIDEKNNEISVLNNSINEIINSRSWKIITTLKKFLKR